MLDSVSLDQLRTFVAAVEEGSFSAASRKLLRAQSVVSQAISTLEDQIGVALFDRAGRYPKLTAEGVVLLSDARTVISSVNVLKARAKGIAAGLEPELSAVIDVFLPMDAITDAAKGFGVLFPGTPLRLYVEAIGGAYKPVLDGRCSIGIVGPLPMQQPSLTHERLAAVCLIVVAAREHPLARIAGPIPQEELARHVQIVLTDRSDLSAGREFGVMSPLVWRLSDLFAKHAFLLNGLGWGSMPAHTVQQDLADGRLVALQVEDMPEGVMLLPMAAIYRTAAPPGPAGRWFIARLKASLARAGAILLACAALLPGLALAQASGQAADAPVPPALTLDRPHVLDTGRLSGGGQTVALFGITGADDAGHELQATIDANGGQVSCEPHGAAFTCRLPDHTDIALASLANGVARATDDAPAAYHAQEDAAQAARRGIWSNLPAPPVTLEHPVARTSGLIAVGSQLYPLDGVQGLGGEPAQELQAYVMSHGDSLACQQQGNAGRFVCTLPDGSDLGQVALTQGDAQAAADAPESYWRQQAEAKRDRRGIWAAPEPAAVASGEALPPTAAPDAAPPPGADQGIDPSTAPGADAALQGVPMQQYGVLPPPYGVMPPWDSGPIGYVGNQPTALIDGSTVFLAYGIGLGWGYYDRYRHWRAAPGRFARYLERFHPGGIEAREHGRQDLPPGERAGPGEARPGAERIGVFHGPERQGTQHPEIERTPLARQVLERPAIGQPGIVRPGVPNVRPQVFSAPAPRSGPAFNAAAMARPMPPQMLMMRPALPRPMMMARPMPAIRPAPALGLHH